MHDYEYDLIVIGAGPGGYVAALRAARLGLRTAVVENREVGGTCLNRGCIPTKAMLHASRLYREAEEGGAAGVLTEGVRLDLPALYARKAEISARLSAGISGLFRSAGVALLTGTGMVLAPHRVAVAGEEGTAEHTARHILVATGSVPARPPIPGLELPGVMTSDELLESPGRLYASIVIIGGGVIGVEFATFYSDLGCQVTLIEGMDRLLPGMDREIGQNLAQILRKRGARLHTRALVTGITREGERLSVQFAGKDGPQSAWGEAVLCAIGRVPLVEGVFAPGLSPEMDGRRIRVDGRFRTSIPNVCAIGDVSSPVQLAHVASAQGTACVEMLCGEQPSVELSVVPGCVYSRPEIACVGMTEQMCREAGIPARAEKAVLFSNARTIMENSDRSFIKVVARTDTHEIVGAQLMCERATDMISQLSVAIANRDTVERLLRAMRPHPTFEEALGECLEKLADALAPRS